MTQLLQGTFGPQTVIGQEFDLAGAERVVIYGSWAARYRGAPGLPPESMSAMATELRNTTFSGVTSMWPRSLAGPAVEAGIPTGPANSIPVLESGIGSMATASS
ncbi:hypothetical protein [Pengzhenrongella sp.]|uniref:hypothetical protein n=1 Tax=Pengzhenrongella sp. TaxID=2888820 RepID=UPI002F9252F9